MLEKKTDEYFRDKMGNSVLHDKWDRVLTRPTTLSGLARLL